MPGSDEATIEATSALDEELEAEIYRMLSDVLPNTTIVSIGHRSTLIALHRRHIEMEPGQGGIFEPTPKLLTATDSLAAETGFYPSVPDHKTAGHLTERQSSQAISKP